MSLITRSAKFVGAAAVAAFLLVGCGAGEQEISESSSGVISAERCATNESAGEVTYVTSFQFAASAGILNVVAAEELGYFEDMCIDLVIEPGLSNIQLVSAGTAPLGGMSAPSDVLSGIGSGAEVTGVATYGNTSAMVLMTVADSGIDELSDFAGRTIGYKGVIPQQLQAMLVESGVESSEVNWVSVGYDPIILPDGQVDALTGFISNEVQVLTMSGHDIVQWNPADYGISTSFATQIANNEFAAANPTVVEDYLRASFHAYNWINESEENLDQALEWAAERSDAGYDLEMSKIRWQTEVELVTDSQPEGTPVGWQTEEQWQVEIEYLEQFGLLSTPVDVDTAFSNAYVEAIYDGTELIWGDS